MDMLIKHEHNRSKSVLSGVARLLDFGTTMNNRKIDYNIASRSNDKDDLAALNSDWQKVGDDLYDALDRGRNEFK